jgi:transposase
MNNAREQRGQDIAKVAVLARNPNGTWLVPSMSGNGKYTVTLAADKQTCTCPDCEKGFKCKHIFAVEFAMKRETTYNADGSTTVTETIAISATKRTTYKQDWPACNEAQTNEQDDFQELLFDLCQGIDNPPQEGRGRPKMLLSDATFAVTFKIYSTFSGRRFMSDLRAAHADGKMKQLPHYNSIFKYLEDPQMTPILERLIVESSKPLAAVESDFAADSSGFSTSRFVRWFDHKYGTVKVKHDWVKTHIMCGVKTNVVTAVEIHDRDASDTKLLPPLLDKTAENFTMREISADKGYSSIDNHNAIESHGATPFIVFKENATGGGRNGNRKRDHSAWEKMFHYFSFKQEEFMAHYHKRSNVESTFSMIKAKFRDHVRSKTDVAMKNEVLAKILCHNICCLISAFYELGIDAKFWGKPSTVVA